MGTSPPRRRVVRAAAAVTAAAAAVFCVVMVLQPWRSCPGVDDSSGGCPALDRDVTLLGVGVVVLLVSLGVLALSLVPPPRRRGPVG